MAQTKRDKEREIARLREQLKNDGELVRHSIFDRSQVVESRKQFGHWEIDLVLPAKMNNQRYQDTTAIMTLTERKTRFTALIIVRSKKSSDMIDAFKLFYERYGSKAVRTITADNGSEFISWDFLEYVQKQLKSSYTMRHRHHHSNVVRMKIEIVSYVIGILKALLLKT